VILPIGIPADHSPEPALADNQKYKIVWQVLQALRAHDERFNEAAREEIDPSMDHCAARTRWS
jgi:predicted helicase